ncbi:MAG: OsmC family peroxiredoxin [Polyangiaceae bacterium]|nr:OsmC family peroxiredoxin [Polyangiaceae bacterium]
MGISKASAEWNGTLTSGKGVMKPAHAPEVPYSLGSRFEGKPGSNPEELIGASLAGCFSMALSVGLEKAGATPKSIRTTADVKLDKDGEGFTITSIALTTNVVADGIDDATFQTVAEATKKGCPVSKALASVPNLSLKATLGAA